MEERQESWSNTLPIKGHDAHSTKSLVLKQLSSIGVPTWEYQSELFASLGKFKEDHTFSHWQGSKPTWWSIYCCSTDDGSNERKVRDDMQYVLAPIPFCLFFGLMCLLHQYHIIVKCLLSAGDVFLDVLGIVDELPSKSFFSCCSITSNTLREFSASIKEGWFEKFPTTPKSIATKLPPRCLIGRWGSAAAFLAWWLLRDFDQLRTVVFFVFVQAKQKADAEAARRAKSNGPQDDEGDAERDAYHVRVGRWREGILKTTASDGLRFVAACVMQVQLHS